MNSGFIKLPRSFLDWQWYDDVNTCRLFLHLLLTVNYTDKQWHGMTIKSGERVCSISGLSEETGLTTQNVRTSLKRLEKSGNLTRTAHTNFTVVTVKTDGSVLSANKQLTSKQQATNKQLTTTKERKKSKKVRNTPHTPHEGADEQGESLTVETARGAEKSVDHSTTPVDERFNRFWAIYPRKVGKGAARKVWQKLKPSAELTETLLSAVNIQRNSEQWQKENGQYIPNPATWLNQERWEDDVNLSVPQANEPSKFSPSYNLDEITRRALFEPIVYERKSERK